MIRPGRLFLLVLVFSSAAACKKTPTEIPLTWQNPAYEGGEFQNLFVIGVGENDDTRRLFEDTFASMIVAQGAKAQASYGVLPQSQQLTEQQVRAAIEGGEFDGVLVTTLLGVDEEQEYVPPSGAPGAANTSGSGYYPDGSMNVGSSPGTAGYYQSYNRSYQETAEYGYYETKETYRLKTELYSVATGDLVWWGQSETTDPKNVADVISSMTDAIAKELKNEGLIP